VRWLGSAAHGTGTEHHVIFWDTSCCCLSRLASTNHPMPRIPRPAGAVSSPNRRRDLPARHNQDFPRQSNLMTQHCMQARGFPSPATFFHLTVQGSSANGTAHPTSRIARKKWLNRPSSLCQPQQKLAPTTPPRKSVQASSRSWLPWKLPLPLQCAPPPPQGTKDWRTSDGTAWKSPCWVMACRSSHRPA
jgi:hypothetical protein